LRVIRNPRLSDFDQINALGRWFQENSLYRHSGWSDAKSLHWVVTGADPESSTFMLVVEDGDEIVGFFLGNIVEYFFSENLIAQDLVMVFKPEHREGIGEIIKKILEKFSAWAKTKNATELCVGVTSGIAGEGYEKLLKAVGFNRVGSIYKRT